MKSDQEKMDLAGRYLAGETTATETSRLEQLMLADEQLRQDFLAYARVDAALPWMINGTGSLLDVRVCTKSQLHTSFTSVAVVGSAVEVPPRLRRGFFPFTPMPSSLLTCWTSLRPTFQPSRIKRALIRRYP